MNVFIDLLGTAIEAVPLGGADNCPPFTAVRIHDGRAGHVATLAINAESAAIAIQLAAAIRAAARAHLPAEAPAPQDAQVPA